MSDPIARPPIAVVGLGALFPGSLNAAAFWRNILEGRDLVTDVPASHWLIEDYYDPDPKAPDMTYARRGAFLPDVEFDALTWGIPPSIVPSTDTSQLLALEVAKRVLEDVAQGPFEGLDRSRTSVILGVTSAQELLGEVNNRLQHPVWRKALREHGLPEDEVKAVCQRIADHYVPWQEATFPGLLGNVVAGRIANRLDLGGTNCVTDAACASTFSALSMAVSELWLGDSDMVIAGGVDTMNDIFMYMCFSKTPALSRTGDCRPFSAAGDGTLLGEGLGMVALKRLADAEAAGDRIYGVVRSVGQSSDGRAKSVYAPLPRGQARALRRAYERADFSPETVELLEAHGTGTVAGDAAEFEGLATVFGATERVKGDPQWCALGSVKSQIGHTKSAAGSAGLIKALMALHHKALPPTIKVDAPNPRMNLDDSAFYLNQTARPWVRSGDHPRRAGVSSFGFGGSNFHVVVEEYTGPGARPGRLHSLPAQLVTLSGPSAADVAGQARALAERAPAQGALEHLARASHAAFDRTQPARLAVVASTGDELADKLGQAAARLDQSGEAFTLPGGATFAAGAPEAGKVAFVFPGQGSQQLDMGAGVAIHFDAAREPWDRAADAYLADGQRPLHRAVFPPSAFTPDERAAQLAALTATDVAQPAIGVTSLGYLALLRGLGLSPDMVAGHSFGELTALHAAGAWDEAAFVRAARARGAAMAAEAAKTPGAMTAVKGDRAAVMAALEAADVADVVPANHNAPDQIILSGPTPAIEAAEVALKGAGLRARRLGVATAFHSPVVSDAVGPYRAALDEIGLETPTIPVYSNPTAAPYSGDAAATRDQLAGAIGQPVRWVELVERMHADGARTFVEVGPGTVLTALVGRILKGQPHRAVATDPRKDGGVAGLLTAVGALAAAGHALDLPALLAAFEPSPDPADLPKPKLALTLNGANAGKPYPPPGGAADLPPPNPPRPTPVAAQPARQAPAQPATKSPSTPVPSIAAAAPRPTPASRPARKEPAPMSHDSHDGHNGHPTALAAPQPALPADAQLAWVAAYQEVQRQTAEAHAAFQRAMTESHAAFLHAAETGFLGLASMMTGQPAAQAPRMAAPAPRPALPAPAPQPVAAAPVWTPPAPAAAPVAPVAVAAPVAPPMPAAAPVAAALVAAAPQARDLQALLLGVVADKTGYPADMLSMDMDLEGDLGVDSIKRVEILGAMQEAAPELPELEPAEMAELRTLGQIAAALQGGAPAAAPIAAPIAAPTAAPAAGGAIDLSGLLLDIVADKTGYPADMLSLDMELEGDLGIDSIKRVEILSAVQEQAPELPELEAASMADLTTLGRIIDALQAHAGRGSGEPRPFDRSGAAAAAPEAPAFLGRFALTAVPAPAPGLVPAAVRDAGPITVIDGGSGLADSLADALTKHGRSAQVADAVPAGSRAVVYLGGLRPAPGAGERAAASLALHGQALAVARDLAPHIADGGLFVTVQDTGGRFGLTPAGDGRAWLGGLAALARTAALEWPAATVRALDLVRDGRSASDLAEILALELLEGGPEREVGLDAAGERITLRSVAHDPEPSTLSLGSDDVVVVSGGARGVTAETVVALAAASQARFLMLGRSALLDEPAAAAGAHTDPELKKALLLDARAAGRPVSPKDLGRQVSRILAGREIRDTLARITAAGGQARYVSADVTDPTALAGALASARADWGAVTAVIHGAGVIWDKPIADKTDEAFDAVFRTKVAGLQALLDATADAPLKALVNFSSVAARCGNVGQCDYAMANEVLNKVALAEARRRPGCVVRSLGWGPWAGGMVTPALKRRFEALGVPLIELEAGARALVHELQTQGGPVEVVLGGRPRPESLLPDDAPVTTVLQVEVSEARQPWLVSHAIQGAPVVPVVLAVEWFVRAARALRPDLHLDGIEGLKVLGGIRLPAWPESSRFDVRVTARPADGAGTMMALEVRDGAGKPRYRATARMMADAGLPGLAPATPGLDSWADRPLYDGHVLFHGPDLQVLSEPEGVSADGMAGGLIGLKRAGWPAEGFQTDVAAYDGALQLAVLWGREVLGGASLPTGIGSIRTFSATPPDGALRGVVQRRETGRGRAVSDVTLMDAETGVPVARLEGVETHLRPDA